MSLIAKIRSNPLFFIKSSLRAFFTAINRSLTAFTAYNVAIEEGIDLADQVTMPLTFVSGLPAYYKNKTPFSIFRTISTSIARATSTANIKHIIMLAIRTQDWRRLGVLAIGYILNTIMYYEPPKSTITQKNKSIPIIKNLLAANLTAMARMVTIDSLYLLIIGSGLDAIDFSFFLGAVLLSGAASYQSDSTYKSSTRATMTACNRGFSIVLLRHIVPALIETKDKWLLFVMASVFLMSFPAYFDSFLLIGAGEQRVVNTSTEPKDVEVGEQEVSLLGEKQPLLIN